MTSAAATTNVWVKLYIGDNDPRPTVFKIEPIPKDVNDLRKAIKKEKPNRLKDIDADELDVYPQGTTFPIPSDTDKLNVWDGVPSTTGPNPLIVVARQHGRPLSSTTQNDNLEMILKDMSISLHTMKEQFPSVLAGHMVTPSTASRNRQQSSSIFDAAGLALKPTEMDAEYVLPVEQQRKTEWFFSFSWPREAGDDKVLEKTSYAPVLNFLRRLDLHAEDVSGGANCVEKLLYNSDIYSRRTENPMKVRGQTVYHKHCVKGRSDLVILDKNRQGGEVLRSMVLVAIEIKTPSAYKQSKDGSMIEAQLQLIGLNAFNTDHSPPVVLSNLAQTHFVIYLAYGDDGWSYVIKKQKCATFPAAIHFALQKSLEASISAHFSRPMTPEG
mmetsp:Transcript_27119/g.38418  ORF Transcript_27119/g.38418 Transcript_27119/m.38418 type:complete len:384 (+) Transcript_27119:37-1188(+)